MNTKSKREYSTQKGEVKGNEKQYVKTNFKISGPSQSRRTTLAGHTASARHCGDAAVHRHITTSRVRNCGMIEVAKNRLFCEHGDNITGKQEIPRQGDWQQSVASSPPC